jgi:hypothetical protein
VLKVEAENGPGTICLVSNVVNPPGAESSS